MFRATSRRPLRHEPSPCSTAMQSRRSTNVDPGYCWDPAELHSVGCSCRDEGRRIADRIKLPRSGAAIRLSFRISRYGVTRTSLGITLRRWREGFPDMSRYSVAPHGATGQAILTRQGISLKLLLPGCRKRTTRLVIASSLHVAMQMGPSHHPVSWMFGVWPLRILSSSDLGFWRFIVCAVSTISANPSNER
jgi:hypothetical protein